MNELSMSMFGSQKDYWKARAERAEAAIKLLDEAARLLDETYAAHAQLEEQLAEEKAARKEVESEANANEEELAVVEELLYQNRQRIEQLEAENERLLGLLKVATCPACDGSGAIPHGPLPDGSWEAEQCQWCDERRQALAQSQEAEKAKGEPSEAMCPTMGRPRKECGCPDCGSSLIDFPSPD